MTRRTGRRFLLGAALLVLAGCYGLPPEIREQARQRRLEKAGVVAFDTTDAYRLAGMSALRDLDLDPVDKRDLDGDTLRPAFGAFHARCSACHVAPDPGLKTTSGWRGTLRRMSERQVDAGLMPMTEDDKALVLDFLLRHAKPPR